MIDINLIRDNPELVKENIKKKFQEDKLKLVDEVFELDSKWKKLKYDEDSLRSERNKISKSIAELMKGGNKKEVEKLKIEAKKIPGKIEKTQLKREKLGEDIKGIILKFPNMLHEDVPVGKDDSTNIVLREVGKKPKFNFDVKGHVDLVESLGFVNTEKGAKVAGSRFYYLLGDLVLLSSAFQRFTMDFLVKKGYIPVQTPYMLNRKSMSGAVSLEDFEESIYKIDGEDLYLIGTSEHALAAYHKDEIIKIDKPIKYFGISSCFRKEAGSHGKDTKGIYRVHRFEKIEQFIFCKPEDEEEIFKLIEIPYRVSALSSGDFSGTMARTHDLEGWFASQGEYRELGSTSTATTYQARKMNTRYSDSKNKMQFVYTLNGTAMTVQRTLCAFLENHQNKDGSINIPKVLQPYMSGIKVIGIKKK